MSTPQPWLGNSTRECCINSDTPQTKKIDTTRTELKGEIAEVRNDLRFLTQRTIDFLAHPPEPHAPANKPDTHAPASNAE